ncbi:TonB-dependent receptor [Mariniflexile fucanivorans]|uniref:TonB-dependent receptor n=1 Tax=Mariniflexile fucanivorans TaxID=264023 RepID=A0A4R1RCF8_9FLAO|nr:TonB-dependent receptor [Mariniflexile fucanivorans]TCL63503.1 TonB-dependent receptor [Mariniflexile fucanivorans]
MLNKAFLIIVCLFSLQVLQAQTGKISGKIIDNEFNDVLAFANVLVKGTIKGTTSDFDGNYTLELDPGTYTIIFSFIGYDSKQLTEVKVEKGKVVDLNVSLSPSSALLSEVVITTSARRNTEQSVLNLQKNSATLMDGLSIESIKKTGASSIASAIKSVPGVSVQEGKFVFVRGLGDRYTKSILNGMDIPGLDPDKNTIQMDIFPTNILENIIIVKSASAELPADFTGGVVDIITKDFPSKKQMQFSVSGSFNPTMHFKDNYVNYKGSNTDFLGFDDGTRALPINKLQNIPNPAATNNSSLEPITRAFNPQLATSTTTSSPDFSFGFSYGNQFEVGDNKLGVIASLDYKNTTTFYEGFENGIYQKPEERDSYNLRFDRRQQGDLGSNNVLASILTGLTYKTQKSKYKLNLLHIQNGESRAALFDQRTEISNAINVVKDNLEYTERSISNILLSGYHTSEDASFTTEWNLSPSLSRVYDKDVRLTTFIEDDFGGYTISSDAGFPSRVWRDLEEINAVGKLDFTKKYNLFNKKASLKFGGLYSYKQREYSIYNYDVGFINISPTVFNGDPDAILSSDNVWTRSSNSGSYIRGNFEPANSFDANQNTASGYISNEFKIGDKLRTILGLRAEYFASYFTGQNNTGSAIFNNTQLLDELDFFPSANLIYAFNEKINFRGSYSKTTARPSFKEKSLVQITDLLTGTIFLGNIDLKPSYIDNFDFRLEVFGDESEMFAISSFYKKFVDPIELVAYSVIAPNQFTPRNSPSAKVLGLEFEARKHFGFISEGLKNLKLNLNISIIESEIEMAKGAGEEYESRQAFARDNETIKETRALQGQSPFLINTGLSYENPTTGFESAISFNVQGKTLEVVGFGQNPDVFVQPFNSLNLNVSKTIGKEKNSTISLKIDNILDEKRQSLYESFGAEKVPFSLRQPGTAFSLGYSMSF